MIFKKIISLLLMATIFGGIMLLGGCGFRNKYTKIKEDSIADGLFQYYLETQKGDTDYYAITGSNQDPCPETLYFPAYYKGKEVKYPFYSDMTFAGNLFGHNLNGANTVYFAFNNELTYGKQYAEININIIPETLFFTNTKSDNGFTSFCENSPAVMEGGTRKFFYTKRLFDIKTASYTQLPVIKIGDYKFIYDHSSVKNQCFSAQIANTSYMFNYENAPNDGYFFINEFKRGGKIKNTPYEPQRKGYKFEGWYKEPNCITKWNFENDTLSEATYDKDGNVIDFIETKFYAKWIKN